jgi:hypothetical protein
MIRKVVQVLNENWEPLTKKLRISTYLHWTWKSWRLEYLYCHLMFGRRRSILICHYIFAWAALFCQDGRFSCPQGWASMELMMRNWHPVHWMKTRNLQRCLVVWVCIRHYFLRCNKKITCSHYCLDLVHSLSISLFISIYFSLSLSLFHSLPSSHSPSDTSP